MLHHVEMVDREGKQLDSAMIIGDTDDEDDHDHDHDDHDHEHADDESDS